MKLQNFERRYRFVLLHYVYFSDKIFKLFDYRNIFTNATHLRKYRRPALTPKEDI